MVNEISIKGVVWWKNLTFISILSNRSTNFLSWYSKYFRQNFIVEIDNRNVQKLLHSRKNFLEFERLHVEG